MLAAVVLYPGFDDLDAFGPFEVLVNAGQGGAPIEVVMASLGPVAELRSSHGARVTPNRRLEEEPAADLVVVPGGGWNNRSPEGAWAEAQRGELGAALVRLHEAGATIASVCTGAGILAVAGLLHERPATTHHSARREVAEHGAQISEARVVDDGEIVTAGGVTSGLDLGLHLVGREFGRQLADGIAAEIEYAPQGEVELGPRARR